MRTGIILLAIMLGLSTHAAAQRIYFKNYTVMDGLVANPVRCIYQDSKGFIWIGTFEGLSRYDGYRFTNYTTRNGLSHHFINSIFEVDEALMIAENNGSVDIVQNNQIRRGYLLPSGVNRIKPYHDRLLLSTDATGFYEYKQDTIIRPKQEATGTPLGCFIPLNDSLLLSDAVDNTIFIFTKDLEVYASVNSPGDHFYSVFRDSRQRVWVCSSTGLKLLQVPSRKNGPARLLPLPAEFSCPALQQSQVTSMIEKDGAYWIGTSKGLVHVSPGRAPRVFEEKDGLPSAYIQTIYEDRESNLWIGTRLGLAKWASKNSIVFYKQESNGFNNDVLSIYPLPEKGFLLNTLRGLQYYDPVSDHFSDPVRSGEGGFTPVDNTSPLQIHYPGHIGILDEKKKSIRSLIKLDTIVPDVHFASRHPSGAIFLGAAKGLYAIDNNRVKKLLPFRVTAIAFDSSGSVWIGTWANGIFRIKQNAITNNLSETADLTSVINQKEIRSLYCESQNVWVGTRYGGVFCLTPRAVDGYQVQQFDRDEGLLSDWVKSIAAAGDGDLWIGTYLGIDRLVKKGRSYRVFNFSKAVGFFAEVQQIVPSGSNEWICVANTGIARFRDGQLHRLPPLQPFISWSWLGGLKDRKMVIDGNGKMQLKHHQNAMRFEFSAPGFINEKHVLYSYRLRGSGDSSWSPPECLHEASYASLSPGAYVFEVRTLGWNGEAGKAESVAFTIQPPFWKTGWFYLFSALCVMLILYAVYRYRIRQLLKWQRTRDRIAADLHDDIGSSLTNISILSELSSKNLHQPQQAEKFLHRITEQIHDSSQAMDDIIWSVNSKNDSVEETFARMRRFAAELLDSTEIEYKLALDENIYGKKINMEQRRDVFLMYKEALNNIIKHAAATKVMITVSLHRNVLLLHIQDNGAGFHFSAVNHRNGLKNLHLRTARWGGTLEIRSSPGKGTDIHISLPVMG